MSLPFLHDIFEQLQAAKNNTACIIEDQHYSYEEFAGMVGSIQGRVQRTGSMHIGVITQNAPQTYATIIACWLTGKAYIPIPAHYPTERIKEILSAAEINTLFYAIEDEEIKQLASALTDKEFICSTELPLGSCFYAYPAAEKTAYILFTSGTTGKPKGVPITFGNLQSFLHGFDALGYEIHADDRFLQMFELTFDLSVVCFTRPLMSGSSFHTLPSGMIKTLALYHILEEHKITFSLMVPSAIGLLLPYLDDIHLPQLRYSQFCGEALKVDLLKKWSSCIPNARIDNVYGPTEATIYCTAITLSNKYMPHHNGVAGIGVPMKETALCIIGENGNIITEPETEGELCLSGMQLTPGYLKNQEQNLKSFFQVNEERFYKTGDLVYMGADGVLYYVGRKDDQVKIQGYRIELGDIESAMAKITSNHVVAIGYQAGETWHLAVFIKTDIADEKQTLHQLKAYLPQYMIPHRIFTIDEIPLNANGKTNRKELRKRAEMQHLSS